MPAAATSASEPPNRETSSRFPARAVGELELSSVGSVPLRSRMEHAFHFAAERTPQRPNLARFNQRTAFPRSYLGKTASHPCAASLSTRLPTPFLRAF